MKNRDEMDFESEKPSLPLSLREFFGRTQPSRWQFPLRSKIILGAALFAILFSCTPAARTLDLFWHQLWSSRVSLNADLPVISLVLEVGEKTNREIGVWPWTRKDLAYLIRFFSNADVRAIFLDDSLTISTTKEEDDFLEKELIKSGNKVYFKTYPDQSRDHWIEPPARFSIQTLGQAHLQTQKTSNGISRYWIPAIKKEDGAMRFHAALKILADGFPEETQKIDRKLRMDQMLIPWDRLNLGEIPKYEFSDWMKKVKGLSEKNELKNDDLLFGKIVWIGSANSELETPPWLEPVSRVRLAAMLFEQMRRGRIDTPMPFWIVSFIFIVFALSFVSFSKRRGVHFWMKCSGLFSLFLILSWSGLKFFQIYVSPVPIFVFFLAVAIAILIEDLLHAESEKKMFFYLATRDGLTDLYGIRHFRILMNQMTWEACARKEELSIILMDIDHFKEINDTYGHPAGDMVLKKMAETIQSAVRQRRALKDVDFVARYGGEEFVVMVRRNSLEGTAFRIAERIRALIQKTSFEWQGISIHVTVSLGVASLGEKENVPDPMVHRADKALYLAKKNGRNRICTEKEIQ